MTVPSGVPIKTLSGYIWPSRPNPEDIVLTDIGRALSNICRFAGQIPEFYSVAQHSVIVADALPRSLRLWGLLHDAPEAYLGDVPRPVRKMMARYDKAVPHKVSTTFESLHTSLLKAVAEKFNLEWPIPDAVKRADNRVLAAEAIQFYGRSIIDEWKWPRDVEPLPYGIIPMGPRKAYEQWLSDVVFYMASR